MCLTQQRFLKSYFFIIFIFGFIFYPEFLELFILVVLSNSSSLPFARIKMEDVKSSLNYCVVFHLLQQMSRQRRQRRAHQGFKFLGSAFYSKNYPRVRIKSWPVGCSLNVNEIGFYFSSLHYYLNRCCSYFPLHDCFQLDQCEGKETHKPNLEQEFEINNTI